MVVREIMLSLNVGKEIIYIDPCFKFEIYFNLSYDGGGGLKVPHYFICENNRKINKIMHCVERKNL